MNDTPKQPTVYQICANFDNKGDTRRDVVFYEEYTNLSTDLATALRERDEARKEAFDAIPSNCPITGMPFFMMLGSQSDPTVLVPTYGGPRDSYTIAKVEHEKGKPLHERDISNERYDHDDGSWKEGSESLSIRLIDEDTLFKFEDRIETLTAELSAALAQLEAARKDSERLDWCQEHGTPLMWETTLRAAIDAAIQPKEQP